MIKARPLAKAIPVYPEAAKASGFEGKVIVKAYIDEQGEVYKTEVSQSSGNDTLDQAAMESVRVVRFEPASRGGKKEKSVVKIPITFQLS